MILEGIVTTLNADGSVNISPMGPNVEEGYARFELRPFQSSTTYQNLKRDRCGVLHVVDDVYLIAQAAVHCWKEEPKLVTASRIKGQRIEKAPQSFEFQVTFLDDSSDRTMIKCTTVESHSGPSFFGFNRAKHSILELAILATRVDFIPLDEIMAQVEHHEVIIGKTGSPREHAALKLLKDYLADFAKERAG